MKGEDNSIQPLDDMIPEKRFKPQGSGFQLASKAFRMFADFQLCQEEICLTLNLFVERHVVEETMLSIFDLDDTILVAFNSIDVAGQKIFYIRSWNLHTSLIETAIGLEFCGRNELLQCFERFLLISDSPRSIDEVPNDTLVLLTSCRLYCAADLFRTFRGILGFDCC